MARKIGVFDANQPKPTTYVKKSVALLLIRRLLAVWEQDGISIRRLSVGEIPREANSVRIYKHVNYIPEKLPPSEIGNGPDTGGWCRFQDPQSIQWRLQHRSGNGCAY